VGRLICCEGAGPPSASYRFDDTPTPSSRVAVPICAQNRRVDAASAGCRVTRQQAWVASRMVSSDGSQPSTGTDQTTRSPSTSHSTLDTSSRPPAISGASDRNRCPMTSPSDERPENQGFRATTTVRPAGTGKTPTMEELEWLGVVRHGQSTGNVTAQEAETGGLEAIDIPERDADVPLSPTGREQAEAVNRWLGGLPPGDRPRIAIVSPYLRTRQTAELALAGLDIPAVVDERLRDRELGVLDLLTGRGVEARLPDEAARRRRLGKFYYRPPGGENWADVLLRLRMLLREVRQDHPGGRVLLFGHEATVLLVRYLAEHLSEDELMSVARSSTIANTSISSWRRVGDDLVPESFNTVEHLHREGATPTKQEDVNAEPV
jgi:broad specificity phosphatase PhoE